MSENIIVKLLRVRLSFPALFSPKAFDENSSPKYSATFRLDKSTHAASIKEMQKAIATLLSEHKVKTLSAERIALKDGDESGREEDEGQFIIKASSDKRPTVLNKDKTPLVDSDNVIYAGCYVNAIISLWFQDHTRYGKRVNASLMGVQFAADGEAFGAAPVTADAFDFADDEEDIPF